jgi:nitroreductase
MPPRAVLVAAADKLHNARSTLADLRRDGERVWARFTSGREGQLWFYEGAAAVIERRLPGPLARELAETVADLRAFPDGQVGLLDGMATTRAIRRIRPEPIPLVDLNKILFAATRAPTGSNRQMFRFLVLRDGPKATEAKAILGGSFRRGWAEKRGAEGYDAGSGLDPSSPKARMARAMQEFVDGFERIPVVVLACMERYREPHVTEGASVYPACQNLLLAARALGYGGVMTIWHVFVEDQLRPLLGIPDNVLIAATIPLGRPVGHQGPVRRRPLAELVFDDSWDTAAPWATDPP